jgi:hypothetical protein
MQALWISFDVIGGCRTQRAAPSCPHGSTVATCCGRLLVGIKVVVSGTWAVLVQGAFVVQGLDVLPVVAANI